MKQRRNQRSRPPGRPPAEGVRIIGAEEAQAALEAGEAAGRRPDDQPRYGDVPPAPSGPRPAHRFPLPNTVDPATAVPLPPLAAGRGEAGGEPQGASEAGFSGQPEADWDPGDRTSELGIEAPGSAASPSEPSTGSAGERQASDEPAREWRPAPAGASADMPTSEWRPSTEVAAGGWRPSGEWRAPSAAPGGEGSPPPRSEPTISAPAGSEPTGSEPTRSEWRPPTSSASAGGPPGEPPPPEGQPGGRGVGGGIPREGDEATEVQPMSLPEDGITVSGDAAGLPHWTDPPTGEVPRVLLPDSPDEDMEAWDALGSRGVRWRDSDDDWEDDDELAALAGEEGVSLPASERSDLYSFDEDFERLQAGRGGSVPIVTGDATGRGPGGQSGFPSDEALEGEGPHGDDLGTSSVFDDDDYDPRFGDDEAELAGTGVVAPRTRNRHGGTHRQAPRGGSRLRPPARPETADVENLSNRIVIGAALVVLLIIAYAIGPKALVVYAAIVVTAAAAEAYGMLQRSGFRPATLLGLVGTAAVVLGAYWKGIDAIPVTLVLVFVGSMLWYLLRIVEARPLANVAVSTMTFVWIGVFGSFAGVMLRAHQGKGLLLGAVIVTVVADVAAFLVGRWIGSRPLAPDISPGKTIEGFVGGLVAAVIAGAIIGKELSPWGGMKHGLVLGVVIGLVAPLGDLFESMMKRDLGLKDSGTMLRSHGGVLDRFDSMLIALPAAYYVAWVFSLVH